MKIIWKEWALALVMGAVVPWVLLMGAVSLRQDQATVVEETVAQTPVSTQKITVRMDDGTLEEMALEDYLTGVILAEMPVSFELEALKAQAVVARTYTLRAQDGKSKHTDAAVCTDSGCCQGYLAGMDFLASGGSDEGIQRASAAVRETAGQVLTYEGELIEATYFSCSGGSTEDAVAVWGTDVPYLQATSSPGEEDAAHYRDTVVFTREEFAQALGLELNGEAAQWLGQVTYTDGGGVDTMVIGGTLFQGTELRKLLDLRSTAFTMEPVGESIYITTRGYGHRVGMSQYGAEAMAVQGSSYEQILAHYYQGTKLEHRSD